MKLKITKFALLLLSAPEGPQQWDISSWKCPTFVDSIFIQF